MDAQLVHQQDYTFFDESFFDQAKNGLATVASYIVQETARFVSEAKGEHEDDTSSLSLDRALSGHVPIILQFYLQHLKQAERFLNARIRITEQNREVIKNNLEAIRAVLRQGKPNSDILFLTNTAAVAADQLDALAQKNLKFARFYLADFEKDEQVLSTLEKEIVEATLRLSVLRNQNPELVARQVNGLHALISASTDNDLAPFIAKQYEIELAEERARGNSLRSQYERKLQELIGKHNKELGGKGIENPSKIPGPTGAGRTGL